MTNVTKTYVDFEARGKLIPHLYVADNTSKVIVHIGGSLVEINLNQYNGVYTNVQHNI